MQRWYHVISVHICYMDRHTGTATESVHMSAPKTEDSDAYRIEASRATD